MTLKYPRTTYKKNQKQKKRPTFFVCSCCVKKLKCFFAKTGRHQNNTIQYYKLHYDINSGNLDTDVN